MDKIIKDELETKLRTVFNDDEFVMCVLSHLVTDDMRKVFIEYIDNNPEITSEELTLMSISAYRKEL